jgi:hypothetical protein
MRKAQVARVDLAVLRARQGFRSAAHGRSRRPQVGEKLAAETAA